MTFAVSRSADLEVGRPHDRALDSVAGRAYSLRPHPN